MIKEPNRSVSVDYTYISEWGDETRLQKTVDSEYLGETELGVLCETFKEFLLAVGFPYLADKHIEFVDDN